MIDPTVLAAKLGVDISGGLAPSNGQAQPAGTDREPVDLSLYPRIDGEIGIDSGDRSKDTYRIGCAVRDCGLDLPHFRWVIDQRPDLAGRVGARHDDDVLRTWERVCREWQAQMVGGAPPSAPPPYSGPSGGGNVGAAPPLSPARFFFRGALLAQALAAEVMNAVLCGYGFRRFYTYADPGGVWLPGDEPIEAEIVRLLGNRFRPAHLANVLPIIKYSGIAAITDEPLSEWINVPNGMVHWASGSIVPHDPVYRSTIQLPVEYVPGADCPDFKKFLGEVLPQDLIDSGFIWELLAYTIFSGNPLHTAVLLIGAGRNGKGTLIRVVKALLGAHNCSSVDLYELGDDKFSKADLLGKLANLAGDLDAKWMDNTATFKKITGEDSVRAQEKYMKSFDFTPWALPFYSTNKAFGSADSSSGWMDRWLIVPFPNSFSGHEDRKLTAKLTSEMELRGILAHAIAALPALMAREQFLMPTSLVEAKAEFMVASDSLRAWVDEECEYDVAAWIPRKQLYLAYRRHATSEGVINPVSNREFYNRIGQMGGIRTAIRGGSRGFSGIKLKGQVANFWSAP